MNKLAAKEYYFSDKNLPLAIRRVRTNPSARLTHEHDLTAVSHTHNFCELVIVTGGRGMHCLEGTDFPVASGDVFLLHQGQEHYFHDEESLELINVMYEPKGLGLPEERLRALPGYCAMFMLEPAYRRQHRFASRLHLNRVPLARAENLVTGIEGEIKGREPGHEVLATNRLTELIVFLSRNYVKSETPEARSLLRVGGVIGELERDYERQWTVPELAKLTHMSRSNLMRVFRKATGQTPIEYLIRLRIQKAMGLLLQTDWDVTRIAMAVGFEDSNYFSRQFRKVNGQSPSRYRQHRAYPDSAV
ncbi:MAG: helix-turn-helix domain-containing protein [Planctomycetes bacterium]|nr:helix-turn-helix domain-containing protein [Planctomycetota bacterium]